MFNLWTQLLHIFNTIREQGFLFKAFQVKGSQVWSLCQDVNEHYRTSVDVSEYTVSLEVDVMTWIWTKRLDRLVRHFPPWFGKEAQWCLISSITFKRCISPFMTDSFTYDSSWEGKQFENQNQAVIRNCNSIVIIGFKVHGRSTLIRHLDWNRSKQAVTPVGGSIMVVETTSSAQEMSFTLYLSFLRSFLNSSQVLLCCWVIPVVNRKTHEDTDNPLLCQTTLLFRLSFYYKISCYCSFLERHAAGEHFSSLLSINKNLWSTWLLWWHEMSMNL